MAHNQNAGAAHGGIDQQIAPHIDPEWSDAFITELRLSAAGGQAIGAALAEAESHVAASGMSAQAAFGDPRAYAQALDLPPTLDQSPKAMAGTLWPILVQLAGLWLTLAAAHGLGAGQPARFGVGLAILIAVIATMPWTGTWFLRLACERPVWGVSVWCAAFLAVVLPEALIPLHWAMPSALVAPAG
ncbi:MAG: hypothetical protein LBE08_06215, partial [Bifidobacteriaceae bacterium]|nr:hypothetical protein [Bifidobacteriaceae bacterium]